MELIIITPTIGTDSGSETTYPGDSLFQELLACNPGPSIDQLIDLVKERNINPSKIVQAIVWRLDFDASRQLEPLLSTLARTNQLEPAWNQIPESFLTQSILYEFIALLCELGTRAQPKSLIRAGWLFMSCPTSDSKEFDIETVLQKIPELRSEAWDRLVQLESDKSESWAVQHLARALKFFSGEDATQKGLWLLERYPSSATDLITHSDFDISTRAAEIILAKPELEYPAIGQLICLHIFRDTDIPARAIQKAFRAAEAGDTEALQAIVYSELSTEDDKIRAADLLIPVCSDIQTLELIMGRVPTRKERARLRIGELMQAQETEKTPVQRLIDQIHQLGPRQFS